MRIDASSLGRSKISGSGTPSAARVLLGGDGEPMLNVAVPSACSEEEEIQLLDAASLFLLAVVVKKSHFGEVSKEGSKLCKCNWWGVGVESGREPVGERGTSGAGVRTEGVAMEEEGEERSGCAVASRGVTRVRFLLAPNAFLA